MNKKTVMVGIGLIAAGYAAYSAMLKLNAVESLRWGVDSVTLDKKETNLAKITLGLKIWVTNPTKTAISFDGFSAAVNLKGRFIADFVTEAGKVVLGPGTTTVTIPTTVSTVGMVGELFNVLKSFINQGGFTDVLTVTGQLYAGGLTIPVSQQINLSFGEVPKQVAGIGKARVSLEFSTNDEAAEYFKGRRYRAVVVPANTKQSKDRGMDNNAKFSAN